jgi:hypothetical protein
MIPYLGPELILVLLREDESSGSSHGRIFDRRVGRAAQIASDSVATADPTGQTITSVDRRTLKNEANPCKFLQDVDQLGSLE